MNNKQPMINGIKIKQKKKGFFQHFMQVWEFIILM